MILTYELSPKARKIALENKNVIAIDRAAEADIEGADVIVDGVESFYPSIRYWDLDGFITGVLSA